MLNVAVIVGSLRKASMNKKLARAFEKLGSDKFSFTVVPLDEVPMFNQDNEGDPPASVINLRDAVRGADGVLFVTPEYNRSLPAVLKNAIDWASRPYGKNSLSGKPAAMAGMSSGVIGTAVVQSELRNILVMLNMRVMGQPEVYLGGNPDLIADDGTVNNEDSAKFLKKFLDAFAAWIEKVK